MNFIWIGIALASVLASGALWLRQAGVRREAHIRNFTPPRGLLDQLRKRHPSLSQADCQLVATGLRQFFLAHLKSGRQHVSMPSQVADDLWHAFILYTKNYQAFCQKAFGRFFHHTPAIALNARRHKSNEGLRRCWLYACQEEDIDPLHPARLPLLFALDAKLRIGGGFIYVPDCSGVRRQKDDDTTHCGGDFSDASIDGTTAGMDDAGTGGGASIDGSGFGGEGD